MKKLSTLLLIFSITSLSFLQAQSNALSDLTVKEQLTALNTFWEGKDIQHPLLHEKLNIESETELIQTHLSLVEQSLRAKDISNLSKKQQANRNQCLDILNEYWKQGTFPINSYHAKRTPYFIDEFNTACAVGYLIQKTGFSDVADKIHNENNYGYIKDLAVIYPEIEWWSNEFGFDVAELAWIQPCYCFDTTPDVVNVSCYGGYDGYFYPDISVLNGTPPYTIGAFYKWQNSQWEQLWCGGCDLNAGEYKVDILDFDGTAHEISATITEPDSLMASITAPTPNSNCNASATVISEGGTWPYYYAWFPSGQTTNTATDLCDGTHYVTITDFNGCSVIDSVQVGLSTAVEDAEIANFSMSPNPVQGQLTIQLNAIPSTHVSLSIINTEGKNLLTQKVTDRQVELDLAEFANGVYFISIDNGANRMVRKVLKN